MMMEDAERNTLSPRHQMPFPGQGGMRKDKIQRGGHGKGLPIQFIAGSRGQEDLDATRRDRSSWMHPIVDDAVGPSKTRMLEDKFKRNRRGKMDPIPVLLWCLKKRTMDLDKLLPRESPPIPRMIRVVGDHALGEKRMTRHVLPFHPRTLGRILHHPLPEFTTHVLHPFRLVCHILLLSKRIKRIFMTTKRKKKIRI